MGILGQYGIGWTPGVAPWDQQPAPADAPPEADHFLSWLHSTQHEQAATAPDPLASDSPVPAGPFPTPPSPGAPAVQSEATPLGSGDEAAFQAWAKKNRIADVDHPDSNYDYRGYWKATGGKDHPPGTEAHFPDTFKQHGHPTFSDESQYSQGPTDGGHWFGDSFNPAARPPTDAAGAAQIAAAEQDPFLRAMRGGAALPQAEVPPAFDDYDHYPDPVGAAPTSTQIAGPPGFTDKLAGPTPDGALAMPDDLGAPTGSATESDRDLLAEGGLTESGPGTASGFNDQVNRLAHDPFALAEAATNRDLRAQSEHDLGVTKANEQQRQDIENLAKARSTAQAKAQADMAEVRQSAKDMADLSPFESWWAHRDTGAKIANVISAVFGGLMAPAGGRNSAIDMMMKVADDDANQKWTKLREQRTNAQGEMDSADADYKMGAAIKLASYEQILRTIDAKAAQFDPEGTAAIALASAKAGVIAKMDAAHAAIEAENYKRREADEKATLERDKLISEDWKRKQDALAAKASNAVAWKNASTGAKAQTETGRHNLAQEAIDQAKALKDAMAPNTPADRLTSDQAKDLQGRAGGFRQVPVAVTNPDGTTSTTFKTVPYMQKPAAVIDMFRTNPDGTPIVVTNPDGSPVVAPQPWIIPTEKEAQAFREAGTATDQMLQNLDEMIKLTREHGWEPDAQRAPAWQKQKVLKMNQLIASKNKANLGVLSESDIPIALWTGAGTDDPTQFRDPLPGMMKARELIVRDRNIDARNLGYTGDPIEYGPPPTEGDNALTGPDALTKKASDYTAGQVRDTTMGGRGFDARGGARPILPPNTSDALGALMIKSAADVGTPNERKAARAGLVKTMSDPNVGHAALIKIALESDLNFTSDDAEHPGDAELIQQQIDALRSLPPEITRRLQLNQAVEGGEGLSTAKARGLAGQVK